MANSKELLDTLELEQYIYTHHTTYHPEKHGGVIQLDSGVQHFQVGPDEWPEDEEHAKSIRRMLAKAVAKMIINLPDGLKENIK